MKRKAQRNLFLILLIIFASACDRTKLNASSCDEPGTIGSDRIANPTQGFDISFQYYLPPCYDQQTSVRYPVIYLITMPIETQRSPHDNTPMSLADRLIHAGKLPPVIIIIPEDTVAHGYHAALAVDLIPDVDETYRTIPDRLYRGVGGISHGGGIAARMALQFPEKFGSLGVLSGGLAAEEKETVDRWIASNKDKPRIRIDVGEQDSILPLTQNLMDILNQNDIPYNFNTAPGGHTWGFWSARMESFLLWFAEAWE